jgi:hypothetical protein
MGVVERYCRYAIAVKMTVTFDPARARVSLRVVSIIESLTKLVDPVAAQAREEERKVARGLPKKESSGAPPVRFECRVCGHRAAEGPFCPTCLAGTMGPLPATGRK